MTPLLSSALLRAQTDDRLVELAAAGHDRAFEAIVERYRRPLLRYLRRLLSDTLAEDVVQATFINAWSSLRTGTEVRELRPWLYRIAHNAAINSLKKVGEAMEEVPESAGGFATEPAAELERRDEMQQALTSIAALPSRQRAALLAVAVDGRAHADVAPELGLTDGAVRQLVHRARTTLRTAATAITPLPLLHAMVASAGDSTVGRVAEVAAGAGGAGAASLSLKAGAAAVLATGALVTGGPQVAHVVHPSQRAPQSAARACHPRRPRSFAQRGNPARQSGARANHAVDHRRLVLERPDAQAATARAATRMTAPRRATRAGASATRSTAGAARARRAERRPPAIAGGRRRPGAATETRPPAAAAGRAAASRRARRPTTRPRPAAAGRRHREGRRRQEGRRRPRREEADDDARAGRRRDRAAAAATPTRRRSGPTRRRSRR